MKVTAQYQRYENEADAISKGIQTAQTRARLQFLLSAMSTMREFHMDKETDTRTASNGDEQRAEKAFEILIRTGDEQEYRTYSPMSDAVQGAFLVPQQWAGAYSERLKAFNGIREAGAQIIGTARGGAWKFPSVDDTSSANDGTRLNENDTMPLVNPTFGSNLLNAFRYVSNGVQLSNELLADSGIPVSAMLQSLFAKRIGRVTQKEFSLGASGGPAGVIPSISNIQAGAAAGLIGLGDLVGLQSSIDEGYLPSSVYMFNQTTEKLLKNSVGSDGRRLYPEMNEGTLLGYPYVRNNAMASPASNSLSVVFGSFKLGVTIRELPLILLVSAQRFGEFFQTYFSLTHRQDCVVTDPNALTVLQQHV